MKSEELPIHKEAYDLLEMLTITSANMPKLCRMTFGMEMIKMNWDMLGHIYLANKYKERRSQEIEKVLLCYRQIQIGLRVCYRQKALSTGRYAELLRMLDSIGRQATAWRNKIIDN